MQKVFIADASLIVIDHLMGEVEPALLAFIKTNISSFIKWDLIRFFYKNRHTIDTAENIARYAGQKLSASEQGLAELVDSGIMVKRELDETSVYLLNSDEKMWDLISKFILACEHRDFRTKVVHHIIQRVQ